MIFLHSALFFILQLLEEIYHVIKYYVYLLFTPIVEKVVKHRLQRIGVKINGKNPWDVKILKKEAYAQIGTYYTLGIGEAFVNKSIECEDLVGFATRVFTGDNYKAFLGYGYSKFFNLQSKSRAWIVGKTHYDLASKVFEKMLDPWMQYSCGYWRDAKTLEEAQLAKMELIARKLYLKPGMNVLDIGCGWGSLAKYLAENYGVNVVGVTISQEQQKYAKEHFAHPNVDIRLQDYRDMNESFDRILSVGMFEHVGQGNYAAYFKTARKCLKDDGIFLLHTIGIHDKDVMATEPFNQKYIFTNAIIPRQNEIVNSIHGQFYVEDWHNFGFDYSKTLEAWDKKFNEQWPLLQEHYDETFYRMWVFYLRISVALFATRKFNLWQLVLTKNGMKGGYTSVR